MDDAPGMLPTIAAIAASLGAIVRTMRVRRVHAWGVPLLLAGWIGLTVSVLPNSIREHWAVLVVAIAVAGAASWLLARVLAGHEQWLLAAGALVLAVRIPVPTGDGTAMLLAPLYVVIAIGAVVAVRTQLRAGRGSERLLPDHGGATRMLDVGAALLPAAATLSLTWSWDPAATTEVLAFYLVPFVLAFALVRTWLGAGTELRPAGWALVASGVAFAAVGLLQAATQQVWWNPKVVDANRFRPDFRTNSLFWDPNIYGRVLVVVLLAVAAWLLVARLRSRLAIAAVACTAGLAAALWNTYSQSSWVALAAALSTLAVLTLPPRPRRWVAAALVVVLVVGVPVAADRLAGDDADGRAEVVRTGVALASERPLLGWGAGSFESAATARELEKGNRDPRLVASHTTPITVFAELGLLGAFTYLTLLASAVVTILARWRRTNVRTATGWPLAPIIWASGVVMALFAHSLLYAGFFEDPVLWVALAVLASLPLAPGGEVDASDADEALGERDRVAAPARTKGVTAHTG